MLWTIALSLVAPSLVSAESPAESMALAPPGPCAEPREQALRADPVYNTAAEDEEGPVFTLSGSPRNHFDPIDVAEGPQDSPIFEPPDPLDPFRTPCSSPDPGCADLLGAALNGLVESDVVNCRPGECP
jgi:hypothetical protein